MPTLTIEYQDEAERLAFEQAHVFFTQYRSSFSFIVVPSLRASWLV
jgi:hypothetical protein